MTSKNLLQLLRIMHANKIYTGIVWHFDNTKISVAIECNDLFWYAESDIQEIKSKRDLAILEESFELSPKLGFLLFCCRKRKMRPHPSFYENIPVDEWVLFNDCGKPRKLIDQK